ncbi:hypothetical protein EMCRGX_G034833 [Ephydatia muelleri]
MTPVLLSARDRSLKKQEFTIGLRMLIAVPSDFSAQFPTIYHPLPLTDTSKLAHVTTGGQLLGSPPPITSMTVSVGLKDIAYKTPPFFSEKNCTWRGKCGLPESHDNQLRTAGEN